MFFSFLVNSFINSSWLLTGHSFCRYGLNQHDLLLFIDSFLTMLLTLVEIELIEKTFWHFIGTKLRYIAQICPCDVLKLVCRIRLWCIFFHGFITRCHYDIHLMVSNVSDGWLTITATNRAALDLAEHCRSLTTIALQLDVASDGAGMVWEDLVKGF